jgi:hypothetical protein
VLQAIGAPSALATKTQPRRSRSSLPSPATPSRRVWSPVLPGQAATSRASASCSPN